MVPVRHGRDRPWLGSSTIGGFHGCVFEAGSEFLVNTKTIGGQTVPTICGLAGGGYVIAWQDSSQSPDDPCDTAVRGQIYSATGAKVGSEFRINTTTALFQAGPSITALANGGFAVTWDDTSRYRNPTPAKHRSARLRVGRRRATRCLVAADP